LSETEILKNLIAGSQEKEKLLHPMHIIDELIDSREYLAQLLPFTTLHIAFCNAFLF